MERPSAQHSGRNQRSLKTAATPQALLCALTALEPQPFRIPARWKGHYRVLLSLRDRLLGKREERLGDASQPLERRGMDEADSATDEFDHDLALGKLSAEQDALYDEEQTEAKDEQLGVVYSPPGKHLHSRTATADQRRRGPRKDVK